MSESTPTPEPRHRSSRKVALLLSEINRTIATIEANGQAGSVAHQRLIAQKISLMGLNAKPKAPDAEPAQAEGASAGDKATYHPWATGHERKPIDYSVQRFCGECRMFVYGDLFENSLEHDPADLPRAMQNHNLLCHQGQDFFREPPKGNTNA